MGLFLSLGVAAQNLVPNPDFEQLIDPEERKEKDFRAYGMVKDFRKNLRRCRRCSWRIPR